MNPRPNPLHVAAFVLICVAPFMATPAGTLGVGALACVLYVAGIE